MLAALDVLALDIAEGRLDLDGSMSRLTRATSSARCAYGTSRSTRATRETPARRSRSATSCAGSAHSLIASADPGARLGG